MFFRRGGSEKRRRFLRRLIFFRGEAAVQTIGSHAKRRDGRRAFRTVGKRGETPIVGSGGRKRRFGIELSGCREEQVVHVYTKKNILLNAASIISNKPGDVHRKRGRTDRLDGIFGLPRISPNLHIRDTESSTSHGRMMSYRENGTTVSSFSHPRSPRGPPVPSFFPDRLKNAPAWSAGAFFVLCASTRRRDFASPSRGWRPTPHGIGRCSCGA